jgi:hypothetical protein
VLLLILYASYHYRVSAKHQFSVSRTSLLNGF